jgi:putative molybdopterin biosynthesis protein
MRVMAKTHFNRVRQARVARGVSQIALAEMALLTRQSIGAIEAGRASPAVDVALRIASALECKVEELFAEPAGETRISTEPVTVPLGGRVALAHIAGRWLSYPLLRNGIRTRADALVHQTVGEYVDVDPIRPGAEARENIVIMGCAPALGLLVDRLNSSPGPGHFIWLPTSSTEALKALSKNQTHVAGVHLVDARTGEANVADVRRYTRSAPVALTTLARWEAGLVMAPGNPKKVRGAGDLGRGNLRLVSREPGSGARRLLERELRKAGLSPDIAASAHLQAPGHLEVAQAVAIGAGDVGIATRDAAVAYELAFVPLAEERYDLAIPLSHLEDRRVERFFEAMTSPAFGRELSSLGYDVRNCGDRVADIAAA